MDNKNRLCVLMGAEFQDSLFSIKAGADLGVQCGTFYTKRGGGINVHIDVCPCLGTSRRFRSVSYVLSTMPGA